MLAARTSSRRAARAFSTVSETSGFKVAAVDAHQPTSSITVLVKAGSRFESKPGVAHALKNFAFKSTKSRSAIGTIRESELYGGVLSSAISREHISLTAEFLRGDEQFFVDVLSSFLTSAKYTRHEFEEYVAPVVMAESEIAKNSPATQALEAAHAIAFRSGLGSSLFANPHAHVSSEDIKSYAQSVFTKDNMAILGTGISQEALSALVEKSLSNIASGSAASSASASSYFGGETRVEAHGGQQTVFVGFGTSGAPSAELAVLAAALSPSPSVKWSKGASPLAQALPEGVSVQAVYLPYSDASLVGFIVQGATGADVAAAGKAAVSALKAGASLKEDDLKAAIAKAKFTAAAAAETRDGLVSTLGSKVLSGGASALDATLSSLDGVSSSALSTAAAQLLKAKPTFVAVGDLATLPHADELGL